MEGAKQETYNPLFASWVHVGLGIGQVCGNCFGPLTPACMGLFWKIERLEKMKHRLHRYIGLGGEEQ